MSSAPLVIPPGIIYGDNATSLISSFVTPASFTIAMWVYVFRVDQEAYLISKVGFYAVFIILVQIIRRVLFRLKD